jgi:hypothetical protein
MYLPIPFELLLPRKPAMRLPDGLIHERKACSDLFLFERPHGEMKTEAINQFDTPFKK